MLRPWGTATAFKPARAGIKRNLEGNVVDRLQLLKSDYRLRVRDVNNIFCTLDNKADRASDDLTQRFDISKSVI